jgi:hypothetical protein
MTGSVWRLTPQELTDLATRLVEQWAHEHLTQPTSAERRLALWTLDWLSGRVDLRGAVELQDHLAALESWTGRPGGAA